MDANPANFPDADGRLRMQDPRKQYPQPPFSKQPQPAPGLAQDMDPKPDHGETSYRGSGKLEGRKALVTGGDSGIGRAAAIAFAREGADVAIVYTPSEEKDAREVIELIEAEGRKALALPGDIKDQAFCKTLVDEAVRELGGLDILVNNAGKQKTQPEIGDVTAEQFDHTMKTNLYAMFWITKAAADHLPAGASIINTASVQAYKPSEGLLDYATTKAGIVAFTKALSKQMIKKGVRANVVAPGPFWTALQPSGGQTQEMVEKFGEESTFGRPGQPVELAPIFVLLASQEGSYVTGEVYSATGGSEAVA
ncbi:SDR family oxidoreductase [Caulobacter sp. S45]|uniref:SDR family oxidoreductase n=1 Tax=Caulobacter sp. S45 TaxID=1641861 RepID=UPI0020B16E04|nr:SDR family oxidoreductase [Caulobacter sp. S45]